jgi:hypothetical protein
MAPGRARDKEKERQWQRRIDRWLASGLSVRAFCARHGLATASFYNWRRVLQRRAAAEQPAQPLLPTWDEEGSRNVPRRCPISSQAREAPSSCPRASRRYASLAKRLRSLDRAGCKERVRHQNHRPRTPIEPKSPSGGFGVSLGPSRFAAPRSHGDLLWLRGFLHPHDAVPDGTIVRMPGD